MSHVVPDLVQKVLKGQDPLHILGTGRPGPLLHLRRRPRARHRHRDVSPGGAQRGLQPLDARVDDASASSPRRSGARSTGPAPPRSLSVSRAILPTPTTSPGASRIRARRAGSSDSRPRRASPRCSTRSCRGFARRSPRGASDRRPPGTRLRGRGPVLRSPREGEGRVRPVRAARLANDRNPIRRDGPAGQVCAVSRRRMRNRTVAPGLRGRTAWLRRHRPLLRAARRSRGGRLRDVRLGAGGRRAAAFRGRFLRGRRLQQRPAPHTGLRSRRSGEARRVLAPGGSVFAFDPQPPESGHGPACAGRRARSISRRA